MKWFLDLRSLFVFSALVIASGPWCAAQELDHLVGRWQVDWEHTEKALVEFGAEAEDIAMFLEMSQNLVLEFYDDQTFRFMMDGKVMREGRFKIAALEEKNSFRVTLTDGDEEMPGLFQVIEDGLIKIAPEGEPPAVVRRVVVDEARLAAMQRDLIGRWSLDVEPTRAALSKGGLNEPQIAEILAELNHLSLRFQDQEIVEVGRGAEGAVKTESGEWKLSAKFNAPELYDLVLTIDDSRRHFVVSRHGERGISLTNDEDEVAVFRRSQ